jgi:7-cyano-7-deazaguanine synthase
MSIRKAVIVLSGGMDSATAMYVAHVTGYKVYAISFYYGQKHNKELEYSKQLCKKLRVNHKIIDLQSITELINNSALTGNIEVPEGHYAEENMKVTVVPNRNMVMYSIAISYAVNIGAEAVYVGVHSGDHFIYPDCRPEFIEKLQTLAIIANEGFIHKNFRIVAPFIKVEKHNIVSIGEKVRVPYELTWSCYKGGEKHCGRCGTCIERKEAFEYAGVPDPTIYE